MDDFPDDGDIERLDAGPAHADHDLGVRLAPHAVDGLGQGQPQHGLVVDMGDQVAGKDPGSVGRRVVDGRDDFHEAVLHRDLDPEPAKAAAGLDLHLLELVGAHVAGVGVECLQHPVERSVDESLVVDRFHVVFTNALKDLAKEVQLPVSFTARGAGTALLVGRTRSHEHHEECCQGAGAKVEARAGQAGHGHVSAKAQASRPASPIRQS